MNWHQKNLMIRWCREGMMTWRPGRLIISWFEKGIYYLNYVEWFLFDWLIVDVQNNDWKFLGRVTNVWLRYEWPCCDLMFDEYNLRDPFVNGWILFILVGCHPHLLEVWVFNGGNNVMTRNKWSDAKNTKCEDKRQDLHCVKGIVQVIHNENKESF